MGDAVAGGRILVLTATGLAPLPMSALSADQIAFVAALSLRVDALAGRLATLEAAQAAQSKRDAAQDAALGQEATARGAGDVAAVGRLTALEVRPEEVAHFSGLAAFPNVAALASFTLTIAGLVSGRPGDVLKAGEAVQVNATLPDGVTMRGPPTVPADGTVVMRFTASVALAAGAPIPWAISALR